ncbi:MAG: DegT/DnrJ/EryC1/StrS family aminotransferase [Chloroflexota bacterium]
MMINQKDFKVPRSRAFETHFALKDELQRALEPVLFGSARNGYRVRQEFEEAFAAVMQQRFACGVHSGTVGIYIGLLACGVQAGDEVITVGNSDISTTAAISQCGAKPIICDILASDYTIDPDQVEALITPRTRAILPVDLYGHPADVKALRAIADRHQLMIMEDAALATGAYDNSHPVGHYADVVLFSFASYKPLGCAGNGAMLMTDDPSIARKLRLLIGYGHDTDREGVAEGHQRYIDEGYNVPLDPLQATLLHVKLGYLPEWTARRQAIAQAYADGLQGYVASLPSFRPGTSPTFRSYTIEVENRQMVFQQMQAAGIEVAIHYAPPCYHHPVYGGQLADPNNLPITEKVASRLLCLPVSPELTDAEISLVIDTLKACVVR